MSLKKTGCLRNLLAVLVTTIVTPVLANVIAEDVKGWQQSLEAALVAKSAAPADWSRPTLAPTVVSPARIAAETPAARPGETPTRRQIGAWHWAAGAWGQ